jgi:diaminobutyrate-2-oxoglutarate transaminase
VDDIQVGNGRTGTFFSFEPAGLRPDIVVVSKAIGGLGLPMSIVLIDPKIDKWKPAEHTGTFRGNNLAFVAAATALRFWADGRFAAEVVRKGKLMSTLLQEIADGYPELNIKLRGRGMIQGLEMPKPELAKAISRNAFARKLIIELAGAEDQVVKFLPPLITDDDVLRLGIQIVEESLAAALGKKESRSLRGLEVPV